ncbi:MAG: ParA family protein [Bradyrhizobium sp.]
MNGKVIAVANMKGGVGKTATVVGIAEAFAAGGKSVLVIDLDAQANASICIAGDATLSDLMRRQRTIDGFISEFTRNGWSTNFDEYIKSDVSNVTHQEKPLKLSLLASSPALRDLERDLIYALTKRKQTLGDIVEALWDLMQEQFRLSKRDFDLVIIDCAPGISLLTEVSVRLADLVVIPTIPDFLSTFGLDAFCANMWDRRLAGGKTPSPRGLPYVVATRCRPINVHRDTIAALRLEAAATKPSFKMFKAQVPEAAAISAALGNLDAHASFADKWTPKIVDILEDIVAEIQETFDARA